MSSVQTKPVVAAVPQLGDLETALIPVDSLHPADSPRLDGVDQAHVAILLESGAELPPILVHRRSMRVIDGMHRLLAARYQGKTHVPVEYFDGDDDAAFVRAVTENISHGLALSLADRKAAAVRIMNCYPLWSDRRVARAVGLSDKTVGALRQRTVDDAQPRRIGQDGRVRPIDGATGRQLAGDILAARPEASLREVARAAGIAPATVRDVRERLRRGDSPMTATQLEAHRVPGEGSPGSRPVRRSRSARPYRDDEVLDPQSILEGLRRDPSLRYTDSGRAVLRWLDRYLVGEPLPAGLVAAVPPHCLPVIARLARHCAAAWADIAQRLEHHSSVSS
ncbi:ParB N-terminal domain-containing protein [Plantactinospora sp. BB1]|uniref:ParB/RepB/Spo0J family partition protein n=1 Tax=Plantactinospora sp. BB1 TaxID=2071627 RepID=UPI000D17A781|nr:ParB N-terminal domain-containing protein [Plantactinospora sp. BB1]AVT38609.1 streptomycin biosynthesis protein [Plantactinospora sp. BB1]